jgi:twinkle protein
MPLKHRKIPEDICRLYGYRRAKVRLDGEPVMVEVADFRENGQLVAQKVRTPEKKFFSRGSKNKPLFGQHLWRTGGRRVIVTEGEIDTLSIATMLKGKWPVVSLPDGTGSAVKVFKQQSEWLNSYDEVVICFDSDKAGQEAAFAAAKILRPGKAKIVSLPLKDANEMLMKNRMAALSTALWEAKTYRPDGILHVSDIDTNSQTVDWITPYPWHDMTRTLMGQRAGEIVMYTSGTGMGKSTMIREIAMHHLDMGHSVGMLMLEESPQETLDDMISLHLHKPVRQIKAARELNKALSSQGHETIDFGITEELDDDEYRTAYNRLKKMGLFLYNHVGTNMAEDIVPKLEYMAQVLDCKVIVLDHITAVVAAMGLDGSERQNIDHLMGELRSFVERTGVHLMLVSQLRKSDGKAYEEGGRITSQDLRGSGSLSSVPNVIIGAERNQQHSDKDVANTIIVRSLKGRFNGRTGIVAALRYDRQTSRLNQVKFFIDSEGDISFEPEFEDETKGDNDGSEELGV